MAVRNALCPINDVLRRDLCAPSYFQMPSYVTYPRFVFSFTVTLGSWLPVAFALLFYLPFIWLVCLFVSFNIKKNYLCQVLVAALGSSVLVCGIWDF